MSFESKVPCLWHAFNALHLENTGSFTKGQLKVLTHLIGNALDVSEVQEKIVEYCHEKNIEDAQTVTFDDYYTFLKERIFAAEDKTEASEDHNANVKLHKVDEVCWQVCFKTYQSRANCLLTDGDVHKLWLVFNFLCETDSCDKVVLPVVMHIEEVAMVIQRLLSSVSRPFDKDQFMSHVGADKENLSFTEVLEVTEQRYCKDLDTETTKVMFKEIHQEYIEEVIKKGILVRPANRGLRNNDRFFVLQPEMCSYYIGRDMKELRGQIPINSQCKVRDVTTHNKVKSCFHLVTPSRIYELYAHDQSERTAWMEALRNAIEHCNDPYTPKTKERLSRKQKRAEHRERVRVEEERRRKEEQDRLELESKLRAAHQSLEDSLLENQKLKDEMAAERDKLADIWGRFERINEERQRVEGQLKVEESQREQDQAKLNKLDQERAELERKLLEETTLREALKRQVKELHEIKVQLQSQRDEAEAMKRDEELVRAAQTRVLTEETEKREELERLKEEMEAQLVKQQQVAEGIQIELQEQQQQAKADLVEQLRQIELDRIEKDRLLQESLRKQEEAEEEKQKLEQKVKDVKKEYSLSNKLASLLGLNMDLPAPIPSTISHRGVDFGLSVDIDAQFKVMRKKRNHSSPASSPISPVPAPRNSLRLKQDKTGFKPDQTGPNLMATSQIPAAEPKTSQNETENSPALTGNRKLSSEDNESAKITGNSKLADEEGDSANCSDEGGDYQDEEDDLFESRDTLSAKTN